MVNKHIAQEIRRRLPSSDTQVLFVCGLPGSGKSTFCANYSKVHELEGIVLSSDWYARYATSVRRKRIADALASGNTSRIAAEENPYNWYDWDRLERDIDLLKVTGSARILDGWDQKSGEKGLVIDLEAKPGSIIWVDGIQLLDGPIRSQADLVILIEVARSIATHRGAMRDSHRSDPDYLAYKAELTRKYEEPYFTKFSGSADIVIDNSDVENPFLLR